MSDKTVDTRGMPCPKPLIMTKKALDELKVGEKTLVLIDNEIAKQNVERFCADNGAITDCKKNGNVFTLTIIKQKETTAADTATSCAPQLSKSYVICIKNDKMGIGADELGFILIKGYLNVIKEIKPLPGTIIFYNNGIHLTVEGSPVLEALKELEKLGVKILVCGTCVDFYNKKTLVKVGVMSNMYDIGEVLANSGHIIYP